MINFGKCPKPWSAHPGRCFVAALSCVPPSLSHLCNSISVLQRALIDLFRRSTKWLAKSHSFFPSLSAPCAGHTGTPVARCSFLRLIPGFQFMSLICSPFLVSSTALSPLPSQPNTALTSALRQSNAKISTVLCEWILTRNKNLSNSAHLLSRLRSDGCKKNVYINIQYHYTTL